MTVAFAEIKKQLSDPKLHKGPGGTGIDYKTIKPLVDNVGIKREAHRGKHSLTHPTTSPMLTSPFSVSRPAKDPLDPRI